MGWGDVAQAVLSLIFVLGLIGALVIIARRYGFGSPTPTMGSKNKRVVILEVTNLDAKRKLVLIRRDETEHLILLGMNGEQVIEGNIAPQETSMNGTFSSKLTSAMNTPDEGPEKTSA